MIELRKSFLKKFKKFKNNKRLLSLSLVAAVLGTLFLGRSLVVAALVNGRPILRWSVVRELESQGGKQVLDTLIERALIYQEAKVLGVSVSNETIDSEVSNIEDLLKGQNISLDDALAQRGQSRTDLIEQIKIQKAVEAILGQKINISEEDLTKHFEENKEFYGKDAKFEELKDEIRQQIFQERLNEEYARWISELRAKAKILYFVDFSG